MLIRDLKAATDEDEKKALRVKLADLIHEASGDEREAIETALLNEAMEK